MRTYKYMCVCVGTPSAGVAHELRSPRRPAAADASLMYFLTANYNLLMLACLS